MQEILIKVVNNHSKFEDDMKYFLMWYSLMAGILNL